MDRPSSSSTGSLLSLVATLLMFSYFAINFGAEEVTVLTRNGKVLPLSILKMGMAEKETSGELVGLVRWKVMCAQIEKQKMKYF